MKKGSIEERLAAIENRNAKVELDKSWEISLTRKLVIATVTYSAVLLFLLLTKSPRPFLSAIVPVIGYLLSTIALPFARRIWKKFK
jgi:hypothetical protein